MTLYAIGDIHGQLQMLQDAHQRVFRDGGPNALIAHVGDLIDKGPDSRGVIDHLLTGRRSGRRWIATRGNHDVLLPQFLRRPAPGDGPGADEWIDGAGQDAAATLMSYGVDPDQPRDRLHAAALRAVPEAHLRYLETLPAWYLHPRALVVHAGIRPGVDLQAQSVKDLLSIRAGFLDNTADHGPLVVHGHTAIRTATHYGNRVNIDGGAGWGRPLCAVAITDKGTYLLTDTGRVPLMPE